MNTSAARTVAVSPWPPRLGSMPRASVDVLAQVAARQDAMAARLTALEAASTDYQSVPASQQRADLHGCGSVPQLSPTVEALHAPSRLGSYRGRHRDPQAGTARLASTTTGA